MDRAIDDNMLAPQQKEWIEGVYRFVPKSLRELREAVRLFLKEMDENYKTAMKKSCLDYVLLAESEQARLGIPLPLKVGPKSIPFLLTLFSLRITVIPQ